MAWSRAGRAPGSPEDKEGGLITLRGDWKGPFCFSSFLHLLGLSASLTPRGTSWFSHQSQTCKKSSASRVALGRGLDLG